MELIKEIYLINAEVVDTRNGYSYRDVWVEIYEDESMTFYEKISGNGDYAYYWERECRGNNVIDDKDEIKYLKALID